MPTPKPSVISIQQYKLITQTDTPTTETKPQITPTPEVLQEIKKPVQDKPSKNVVKEDIKKIKTPQETQTTQPKQEAQPQSQSTATTETTEMDTEPATEPTYFGITNATPKYPIISFQLGEYGNVVIEYTVTKEGFVDEATIVESSGFLRLDRTALTEFKKWKFQPAKNIAGTPVHSRKKIITFAFDIKTQEIKAE